MSAAHLPSASGSATTSVSTPQRSTRGASKQRRDQINVEIQRLRDLLPLSESIKDRLYQLQIMSLGCIYMRKHRYLQHVLSPLPEASSPTPKGIEVCKALRGFMLLLTRNGKMLHVSENASEYLGHSVEEIMCQGDSIYDLVDHRDHAAVQAELASGPPSSGSFPEERVFICRLNLTRAAAKRQLQYHKFILLQGRYIHPAEYYQNLTESGSLQTQPMFAAYCQPLINPENAESISSGNTTVFTSQHYLDMKFKEVDSMCAHHLGYSVEHLEGSNWYQLLHPSHVLDIAPKHRLLCMEKEGSVLALIRLQTSTGEWLWLHTVLAVKGNFSQEIHEGRRVRYVIHCYYQILSELEAATLQANAWIYTIRHTYPAAFPGQADSPESEQEHPVSPASPVVAETFHPVDFSQFVKQEPFTPLQMIPPHHFIPCDQIKVEIPLKVQPAFFTPESSSPESAASLTSNLLAQPFHSIEAHPLLDEIPSKGALPELRDELDEFFRQVEELPQGCAPTTAASGNVRHSPQTAELYRYMGPFQNHPSFIRETPLPRLPPHRFSLPDCSEYCVDPFFARKMSWAV